MEGKARTEASICQKEPIDAATDLIYYHLPQAAAGRMCLQSLTDRQPHLSIWTEITTGAFSGHSWLNKVTVFSLCMQTMR